VRSVPTLQQAKELLPILEQRRSQVDVQLWGAPTLLVVAQAFLYAAAFGSVPHWARLTVLGIGPVVLAVAWRAMSKMRYLETTHSEAVARCLAVLDLGEIRRGYPDSLVYDKTWTTRRGRAFRWVVVWPKAHYGWYGVFLVFIAADIAFFFATLLHVQ
jgi:hypothetical protein